MIPGASPAGDGWHELEGLFSAVLPLAPPERGRFLERACAGRPELRREVTEMVAASGPGRALRLEARLLGWDDEPAPGEEPLPGYRLGRPLGRGGMGEVYQATRAAGDFDQRVAVKLMRPGLLGADLAHRFRAERRILARLEHPHVVPLLDGGVTADGRPYLVMPYVDGVPITDSCARRSLPPDRRVQLLAAVCRAVQHAHANLVVHRDLKPSNILVTADGEPRLLDFGIAKLLDPETGRPADLTRAQVVWITPERAAPEQLRGEPVSTATDVYALGVLLVELTTGRLPPVARPGAPAATRREKGHRALRGDLEQIALKALDPEPARRYASAGQLADDLERWRAGRPVLARPDRRAYRAAKLLRRHLPAAIAGGLALALLVAFAATAALAARRIAAERDRAAAGEAEARRLVDLVVGLFETADPEVGRGGETLAVEDFLAAGEASVAALHSQPALQARMEHVLGRIRLARGDYRQARALFERAEGRRRAAAEPDEAFAVDLGLDLARALETTSDLEGSERMLDELLPRLRRVRGDDHPLVSRTLVRLGRLRGGPQGAALAERSLAIERRRRPPNPTELGRALAGVAEHRSLAGDRAAAEALFGEAAEIFAREHGDEHPYTQTTLTNLAGVLDDFDRQEALYRRLIAMGRQVFGADSAPVANRLHRLGILLGRHGRRAEAEAALSEAERIWTEVGGPDHWRTVRARESLAELREGSGSDRGDRSRGSRPR